MTSLRRSDEVIRPILAQIEVRPFDFACITAAEKDLYPVFRQQGLCPDLMTRERGQNGDLEDTRRGAEAHCIAGISVSSVN
jgi:hypothetical protein